jgi:hypothetical protein
MIGAARRFPGGKGVNGGEKIEGFPAGSEPHSSEAWIRSDVVNGSFVAGPCPVMLHHRAPMENRVIHETQVSSTPL